MDGINNISLGVSTPTYTPVKAAPQPSVPSAPAIPAVSQDYVNAVAAEQQQIQAHVQAPSQSDVYVVSDRKFTVYKVGGEYITRYVSLRDGKVTYTPSPDQLKNTSAPAAPSLNIKV